MGTLRADSITLILVHEVADRMILPCGALSHMGASHSLVPGR